VVRRVALPDAFLATDGRFETLLSVLADLAVFPAVIDRELDRYLPFLATTKMLTAAVRRGAGREQAHAAISEHAVAVTLTQRTEVQRQDEPHRDAASDLLDRLAADPRLGLDRATLEGLVADRLSFAGMAPQQVEAFCSQVAAIVDENPEAAGYRPAPVL
jgi:adenylosuccinate lyase